MRKLFGILILLTAFATTEIQPVSLRALPEHMRSYKNYLIVCVHGMGNDASVWDDLRKHLPELAGDASFAEHIFAYTLRNPSAAYYGNAEQVRSWLERARSEFDTAHPDLPPAQRP